MPYCKVQRFENRIVWPMNIGLFHVANQTRVRPWPHLLLIFICFPRKKKKQKTTTTKNRKKIRKFLGQGGGGRYHFSIYGNCSFDLSDIFPHCKNIKQSGLPSTRTEFAMKKHTNESWWRHQPRKKMPVMCIVYCVSISFFGNTFPLRQEAFQAARIRWFRLTRHGRPKKEKLLYQISKLGSRMKAEAIHFG